MNHEIWPDDRSLWRNHVLMEHGVLDTSAWKDLEEAELRVGRRGWLYWLMSAAWLAFLLWSVESWGLALAIWSLGFGLGELQRWLSRLYIDLRKHQELIKGLLRQQRLDAKEISEAARTSSIE